MLLKCPTNRGSIKNKRVSMGRIAGDKEKLAKKAQLARNIGYWVTLVEIRFRVILWAVVRQMDFVSPSRGNFLPSQRLGSH